MKNLLFHSLIACLLLFGSRVHAQTENEIETNGRTFSQIFDSLSTGLIPARIPYGTLYDRVYPWSGLSQWTSGDTTSVAHLYQSWYDAELSVIDAAARPNNYGTMRDAVQYQLYEGKLPVVVINFQFAYIDSTAVDDGRLSITDGMFIDNQQGSPYLTNQVTVAGIAIDRIMANKNYVLQYGDPLLLNNTSTAVQSIVVDDITGGTQYTLSAGVPQLILFTQAGNHVLQFTVNLDDASSISTYQVISVEDINSGMGGITQRVMTLIGSDCAPTNELIESVIPFQGYGETQATNSFADYHIYYHTQSATSNDCEKTLKKPLIVLDGFDPENGRQYYNLYDEYLVNKDNQTSLGDDLRKKGYDVILLNFPVLGTTIEGQSGVGNLDIPFNVKVNGTQQTTSAFHRDGGADYIERNAFILVKLIQEINDKLAANNISEKIVIVGPSMGGQISRYALAYMEKKQAEGVPGMDHNTRLWVSFDSPHDGANIPLSIQKTLEFYGTEGGNVNSKDAYDKRLRAPAARQLLIEQLDGTNSTAAYHQTYYNNLRANGLPNSNGYPQNLRKVTLANGSGSGTQTYGDGTEILNGVGRKTFLNLKVFELIDNFMPPTGTTARVTKAKIAIPAAFIPFYFSITFLTSTYEVNNFNNRGGMDALPGGTNNTAQTIYEQFNEGLRKQKVRQTWPTVQPDHCFIPTISALGFKFPYFNWNARVDNRNLTCNEIYFDDYYVPASNQPHVYLNTDNINWLTQQIDNTVPSCVNICSLSISGDNNVCNTSNNYTVDNLPGGATVHWEVTPSYLATPNTPNSPQTTITRNGSGNITLTATVTNACNQVNPASKSIHVGNYSDGGISIYGPSYISCGETVRYFATEYQGVSYQWTYPGSWNYLSGQYTSGIGFQIPNYPYSSTAGYVGLTVYDACGTNSSYIYVNSSCGGYYSYSLSPNPASSTVTVNTKELAAAGDKTDNSITEVNIYDQLGNMKKHQIFGRVKTATLNISGLNKGVYFIEIVGKVGRERQQLLIKR